MGLYERYISLIRDFEEQLREHGRQVRQWRAQSTMAETGRTREPPHPDLVLRQDTAVELGGPGTASTSFTLWSNDTTLLRDRAITLIGPDLDEAGNRTLPIGQALIVAGQALKETDLVEIERARRSAERVRGYSARRTGGRLWSRVSCDALDSGLNLRTLGQRALAGVRTRVPFIEAAELLCVTSSAEDVDELDLIGAQVRKLSHDLRRGRLVTASDGGLECQTGLSCDECPEKPICDDIRVLIRVRKRRDVNS